MKKSEKRGLLILIIVAALIIGVIYLATRPKEEELLQVEEQNEVVEEFVQVLEDGTKLNTSTKLSEAKTVNGLEFSNITLTEKEGQSMLIANVKNNTGRTTDIVLLDVTLLDKEGNQIVKLAGAVAPLEVGEEKQFQVNTTLDYANAYDFKIEIKN